MRRAHISVFVAMCAPLAQASAGVYPSTRVEIEQFYGAKYPSVTHAEYERLISARATVQKTGICNLHHIRMRKTPVPMYPGIIELLDPYYATEARYFPNARTSVLGSDDIIESDYKKKYYLYICPECMRAARQWAVKHPRHWRAEQILQNK